MTSSEKADDALRQRIGSLIRNYRLKNHLTQGELAKQVGYESFQAIALIEKGERGIKIETLTKIARVLEVPLDEFFLETKSSSISLEDIAIKLRANNVDKNTEKSLLNFAEEVRKKFGKTHD